MTSTFGRLASVVLGMALFLVVATASAQKPYVYDFLRSDVSARASAMGGTFITVMNDVSAIYYNPATLNTIDSSQVAFSAFKHLLDINSGSLMFATDLYGIGKTGFGISYNNYGSFQRRDKNGQDVGEFGSSDIIAIAGWGTTLGEGFSAGVNAKAIFSTIDTYSSSALALDGGLLYADTASRFQAAASIQNLGGQLSSFGQSSEPLPIDLRVGVSHQLRGLPLLIALNFSRLLDEQENFIDRFAAFSVGGEFTLSRPIRLRIGYNNRIRQDVPIGSSKGLSGFSGGVGIVIKDYRLDYSFNSLERLGGQHRVTLNASF